MVFFHCQIRRRLGVSAYRAVDVQVALAPRGLWTSRSASSPSAASPPQENHRKALRWKPALSKDRLGLREKTWKNMKYMKTIKHNNKWKDKKTGSLKRPYQSAIANGHFMLQYFSNVCLVFFQVRQRRRRGPKNVVQLTAASLGFLKVLLNATSDFEPGWAAQGSFENPMPPRSTKKHLYSPHILILPTYNL